MSKSNDKRHTKPCVYFQTNDCPLPADECDFAHVITTPEQYETLKNPQATLRTKPCRFYLGGQCKDGYWCRFKHPANMFAASTESDASLLDDVPELDSDKSTDDDVDVRELNGAWKAKPEEHPKYRTRPCRNFILGRCVYGDRCSYLHVSTAPTTPMKCASPPPVTALGTVPSSYFPATPPCRAPNSTPITTRHSADADVEIMDLDPSAFSTPVRARFDYSLQTPSTASHFTDEPATPVSPPTPGNNEYTPSMRVLPQFPMSPLSPLSYAPHDYRHKGPLDCTPLSPPFSMYSPTSPVPLRIVHVPFAVPMYQEMSPSRRRASIEAQKPQQLRPRAFSQPDVEFGTFSRRSLQFRSKPCKFFNEFGRCHKGDRCNFSHTPASPCPLPERAPVTRRESITGSTGCLQHQNSPAEDTSCNFYKINWRVVGGGVRMGTENSVLRRRSEDAVTSSQCPPTFKNPFNPDAGKPPSEASALDLPIDLKERAHSIAASINPKGSRYSSTKKGADNALSLTLQSYSLAKASANFKCSSAAARARPIIVVQGDDDEKVDWGDGDDSDAIQAAEGWYMSPPRQDGIRARSSPSSPVSTQHDLPNMIFSAESP